MSSLLLHFPPFRLDPSNERLWDETQEIPLRPKTFAVLRYLVEHAEQLVTKDELMSAVWSDTVVGDDALTSCVQELRRALGDDARQPRYIETVYRRGFRFIAPLNILQPVQGSTFKVPSSTMEQTETEMETEKGQAEGLRLQAAEPPLSSPFSLQPSAYSLSQDSERGQAEGLRLEAEGPPLSSPRRASGRAKFSSWP